MVTLHKGGAHVTYRSMAILVLVSAVALWLIPGFELFESSEIFIDIEVLGLEVSRLAAVQFIVGSCIMLLIMLGLNDVGFSLRFGGDEDITLFSPFIFYGLLGQTWAVWGSFISIFISIVLANQINDWQMRRRQRSSIQS